MLARWFVTGETDYERVNGTGGKGEAGGLQNLFKSCICKKRLIFI